jgi:hypothetical protein
LSLGGRPEEEDGHKPINLSLNAETHKVLMKIHNKSGNRSKFVEKVVRPHIQQLDPGESCKILGEFDQRLRNEIVTALSKHNFEKAATLATIGDVLTPFMSLCRIPTGDASENKEHP